MLELDKLNYQINDQTQEYNWIEYRKMQDDIEELEQEVEDLMKKLENLEQ